MEESCKAFQIEWLNGERAEAAHSETCAACARWVASTRRVITELERLDRMAVPQELDTRVAAELSGDRSRRLERMLGSMARHAVPSGLDERVAATLAGGRGDRERGERKAKVLRALDIQPAPEVLERLLDEELTAPERHVAERFPGNLERLRAPTALDHRVETRVRRRSMNRLVLGPTAALLAAALVLWFSLRSVEPESRYRFRVVQASSLDGIDPRALSLAEAIGGTASPLGTPR